MKSDVLDSFNEIKACVSYEIDGEETNRFPFDVDAQSIKPVYKILPGWNCDMTTAKSEADFPVNFVNYIKFLESELETPITIVSVGPDREQTIKRKH